MPDVSKVLSVLGGLGIAGLLWRVLFRWQAILHGFLRIIGKMPRPRLSGSFITEDRVWWHIRVRLARWPRIGRYEYDRCHVMVRHAWQRGHAPVPLFWSGVPRPEQMVTLRPGETRDVPLVFRNPTGRPAEVAPCLEWRFQLGPYETRLTTHATMMGLRDPEPSLETGTHHLELILYVNGVPSERTTVTLRVPPHGEGNDDFALTGLDTEPAPAQPTAPQ